MIENQWASERGMRWKGALKMPALLARCQRSNLLSLIINAGPLNGPDKMLFQHQGYHLMSDNAIWEQSHPTVKTKALTLAIQSIHHNQNYC